MFSRLALASGTAVLLVLSACSPQTRYDVLSFFFDGVPKPGEAAKGPASTTMTARAEAATGRKHGPYAAKMCSACHRQDGSNQLILPVEKLCLNCHNLNIRTRKIHGPVASGGCRVCHDPHGTGKPFMLVAEPSKFCFHCHDPAEVGSHEVHKSLGGAECTDCHNPHGSDNDFLLK
jgi:predicted CXXCH cytochrome family protein